MNELYNDTDQLFQLNILYFLIEVKKQQAVVAERLRRLTRNQILSGSVGSSPTDCENIFVDVG
jgi:hypothetical protein